MFFHFFNSTSFAWLKLVMFCSLRPESHCVIDPGWPSWHKWLREFWKRAYSLLDHFGVKSSCLTTNIAGTKPVPASREAAKTAFPLPASRLPFCPRRPPSRLPLLWKLYGQVSNLSLPSMIVQKQGSSIFVASTDVGSTDASTWVWFSIACPPTSHKSPASSSGLKGFTCRGKYKECLIRFRQNWKYSPSN